MNKYQVAYQNIQVQLPTNDKDILVIRELVEKSIHPIKFVNECNCIFDEVTLYNAIDLECENINCYRHDEYKIFLHNGYPCINIGHDKHRIHVLIGKLMYGRIRKGYVIHHKDFNKLNALESNLEYLSNNAHTKLHHTGVDYRSEKGKWKGVNSSKEKRYKSVITKDEIEKMIEKGISKQDIAKHFQCSINTIYRRLSMNC